MTVAEDEGYKGSGLEQVKHPGYNSCNRDAFYMRIIGVNVIQLFPNKP
ncbi:hypothetical protein [Geosporobacter subterraneus]|nr:hypothetical protein [Geosporobacter subterraneus]